MAEDNITYLMSKTSSQTFSAERLEIDYEKASNLFSYISEKGRFGNEKISNKKPFPSEMGTALMQYQRKQTRLSIT
jgi:ribosomal protein S18